jgi:hypothetical protein
MKIEKLEVANKGFEIKIKTLNDQVNAVDNLKKRITNLENDDRVSNLEDDLETLRADFDDHRHY